MQFVMIAKHAPELCPSGNAKIRQMMKEGSKQIPDLAKKLGLKIITLNVYGPDHQVLAVFEGSGIEAVREFTLQSRLIQWNTVEIHATWTMDEAMSKVDTLPTIF